MLNGVFVEGTWSVNGNGYVTYHNTMTIDEINKELEELEKIEVNVGENEEIEDQY